MTYLRIFIMLATAFLTLWASYDFDPAGWVGAFGTAVWIYANALALQEQVRAEQ